MYYFILLHRDSVYIRKRNSRDIWQNLHEFVLHESEQQIDDAPSLVLPQLLEPKTFVLRHTSEPIKQQLTHQKVNGQFFVVHLQSPVNLPGDYVLVKRDKLQEYAFPRLINLFLESNPI